MKDRLKRLLTSFYSKDRLKRPLPPGYHTAIRLLTGGALGFCSLVVVQLLQIPPPQLTTNLWWALWCAAVAIFPLVGVLAIYAHHEEVKIRHETGYKTWMVYAGPIGTFLCVVQIFSHFFGAGAFVFLALFVIVVLSIRYDREYHAKINAPRPDNMASLSQFSSHYY